MGTPRRNVFRLGILQHAEEHENNANGQRRINQLHAQIDPKLPFILLLKIAG